MVIISKSARNQFGTTHANAADALDEWYDIVKKAGWRTLADVMNTFNPVDYVGDNRYIFNIKGNNFRLVTLIFFSVRTVYIKFVGAHAGYDKIDVKTIDLK